jgi:hypothetical protein
MKKERKPGPRTGGAARDYGKPRSGGAPLEFGKARGPRPARFGADSGAARPPSRFRSEERPPRPARPRREERGEGTGDFSDPYQRAQRPPRARDEGGRGFTVTLDADVARVFRGDASVNKALRLVLQLMQVVQGPPPSLRAGPPRPYGERPRPPRPGFQGSAEARGFSRKPRFEDNEPDVPEE